MSLGCGDAILGPDEECDDGPGEASDGCTNDCQTRDFAVVPASSAQGGEDRYLGQGRHPLAGSDQGFIASYMTMGDAGPQVSATVFDIWGKPQHLPTVSDGAQPIDEANPVAAALPDGRYAVAWTDFDGDGSDLAITLRGVSSDGTLGPLRAANAQSEFSQSDPDMIWTGSELVVAWVDFSNAATAPDLRYRTFNAQLTPTSGDLTLANGVAPEAAVALAPFNDGWAAAYFEGVEGGVQNVVVVAAGSSYRVGPFNGGPLNERPALVGLDAEHLMVVFSAGTPGTQSTTWDVPRLRYAVIDTQSDDPVSAQSLDPLDDVYLRDQQIAQLSPAAVRFGAANYVAWRSEAQPGDAAGDQLWLKYFEWRADQTPPLRMRESETLLPRTCEGALGDQRQPALATVDYPPSGALALAWNDYAHLSGTTGSPDVVVQFAPLHERAVDEGRYFTEDWSSSPDGTISSPWAASTTGVGVVGVVNHELKTTVSGGSGSGTIWNDEINALNVDMTVRSTWELNGSMSTLFARRTDEEPNTYVSATFGTLVNGKWTVQWVNNSVVTELASAAQPPIFTNYAQKVDYWLRFRVETFVDESMFVGGKLWEVGSPEPTAWTVQTTLAATSAAARSLALRPGRFGVTGSGAQSLRHTYFDDLVVKYFEDGYIGSFAQDVVEHRPLRREAPLYASCRPGQECAPLTGCCTLDDDCMAGSSCNSGYGELARLGSSADVCVANHCFDLQLNGGEVRTDCGGPDCGACTCTSTAAAGSSAFCSASCRCGVGEGDCDSSAECLAPLICNDNNGLKYGLLATDQACAPAHCINRTLEPALGETGIDCGGPCGQCVVPPNGAFQHCRVWQPCPNGEGGCLQNDECAPGLVCGGATTGARFGLPAGTRACVKQHCTNNAVDSALGETSLNCGGECGTLCP